MIDVRKKEIDDFVTYTSNVIYNKLIDLGGLKEEFRKVFGVTRVSSSDPE